MPVQEDHNTTSCEDNRGLMRKTRSFYVRQEPESCRVSDSQINYDSCLVDDLGDLTLEDIYYYKDELAGTHEEEIPDNYDSDIFTLEDLKAMYNSCFTCGVSWIDDHVSLDCSECGGYGMKRPCPICNGSCSSLWTRNINMSHNGSLAHWEGKCSLRSTDNESAFPKKVNSKEKTVYKDEKTNNKTWQLF